MGQMEDMEVFLAIVETGGVTRASERLGLAKSAVSRRLIELEGRLGVQLINRTTRVSNLTETGEAYYKRAKQIVEDVRELDSSASVTAGEIKGTIRCAVPYSFGLQHLAPAMCAFMSEHPDITLEFDFSDRQVDVVGEGFDLAVRIAELKDSSLIARRLAPIRMQLCASPTYLEKNGVPQHPSDLENHQGLIYSLSGSTSWLLRASDTERLRVSPKIRSVANCGDFLCGAAVAGHGIALLPTFMTWREVASGALVPVLCDFEPDALSAYAIYPPTRHLSQRIRVLIDFLSERFGEDPYWDVKAHSTLKDEKVSPA